MIRRGLVVASIALLGLGLELSTEALSLTLARLRTGIESVFTGAEFFLPGLRFAAGLVTLLVGAALLTTLVAAGRATRAVARHSQCPQCGNGTRRMRRNEWHRLLSTLNGRELIRIGCEQCGWSGLSRG